MSTFLSILSIFYIVKPNLTDCARCPDIWVMSDNCFLFSLLCIILFESRKLSGLVDFVCFYDLLYCNVSRLRGHFCTSQHDSCAKMQSHIQFAIRDKERTLVACTTCFPAQNVGMHSTLAALFLRKLLNVQIPETLPLIHTRTSIVPCPCHKVMKASVLYCPKENVHFIRPSKLH